jgi:hypothetical protein
MDYGYILRRAWEMTWRHKTLWLFGLLVSLSSLLQFRLDAGGMIAWLPAEVQQRIIEITRGPYPALAVGILALPMLLVALTLSVLSALGRVGLMDQVNRIENGGQATARGGLRAGKRRTWPVFLITLLLSLPTLLVVAIGFIPYILRAYVFYLPYGPGQDLPTVLEAVARFLVCLLPAFLLSLLLAIPLRVLQRLAVRACVLENLPVAGSAHRAWEMMGGHPGALALLWLTFAGVSVGIAVVVGSPLGLLILGFLVPSSFLLRSPSPAVQAALWGTTLSLWLVGAFIASATEIFFSASWTLAYRELVGLGRTGEEGTGERHNRVT